MKKATGCSPNIRFRDVDSVTRNFFTDLFYRKVLKFFYPAYTGLTDQTVKFPTVRAAHLYQAKRVEKRCTYIPT